MGDWRHTERATAHGGQGSGEMYVWMGLRGTAG